MLQPINLTLAIALVAAAQWVTPWAAWADLRIVTSFPQDAAIAKAIGGDKVVVNSLARAAQDPHALQPKPSLAVLLNRADLLIVNGQDMELAWLPIALTICRNGKILEGEAGYFNPSEGVTLHQYTSEELKDTPFFYLNIVAAAKAAGGGQVSVTRGNHHYWLDPANGLVVAKNITVKMSEMDPGNADTYHANLARFSAALSDKIKQWDAMMEPFKGAPVVTYHRDWTYLINRHGLHNVAYIEPRETIPPSAGEMVALIKRIKEAHVRVIMTSPWQNLRIPQEIAGQTGVPHVILPSSVGEDVGVKDYFDLFDQVYGKLTAVLSGSKQG